MRRYLQIGTRHPSGSASGLSLASRERSNGDASDGLVTDHVPSGYFAPMNLVADYVAALARGVAGVIFIAREDVRHLANACEIRSLRPPKHDLRQLRAGRAIGPRR